MLAYIHGGTAPSRSLPAPRVFFPSVRHFDGGGMRVRGIGGVVRSKRLIFHSRKRALPRYAYALQMCMYTDWRSFEAQMFGATLLPPKLCLVSVVKKWRRQRMEIDHEDGKLIH